MLTKCGTQDEVAIPKVLKRVKFIAILPHKKKRDTVLQLILYTTYCKIKTSFRSEKYLHNINNFTLRGAITKLRISSHRLKIETGRYLKLEVNKRLCNKCDLNKIEDEIHFLQECPSTSTDQQVLIVMINNSCSNFQYLNLSDKFFWLLNCELIDIIKQGRLVI